MTGVVRGNNSLEPQKRISLNYGAKEYLALLPSFYELHASLQELLIVLEISLLYRDVCLPGNSSYLVLGSLLPYLSYWISELGVAKISR
jgi:hypothetical protein